MQSNVILENPQDWLCKVVGYSLSHSTLAIQLRSAVGQTQKLLAIFRHTSFFSGPFQWKSANFQIANQVECFHLLRELSLHYQTMSDEQIADEFQFGSPLNLFYVERETTHIQILASDLSIVNDTSPY